MKIPAEGKLLMIFIGESDKWRGKPLYQEIVNLAKQKGMAGATAVKGFLGFGCNSHPSSPETPDFSPGRKAKR